MILISHRGNIDGRIPERENEPSYIDEAISLGYDVEIDVWVIDDTFWLGHDSPEHPVEIEWLVDRDEYLWIHCKNVEAMVHFSELGWKYPNFNFFWHENDSMTLTSFGWIWVNIGKQPIRGSIAVSHEPHRDDISQCAGVCSDFIKKFSELVKK
jgi:hypothetical protein